MRRSQKLRRFSTLQAASSAWPLNSQRAATSNRAMESCVSVPRRTWLIQVCSKLICVSAAACCAACARGHEVRGAGSQPGAARPTYLTEVALGAWPHAPCELEEPAARTSCTPGAPSNVAHAWCYYGPPREAGRSAGRDVCFCGAANAWICHYEPPGSLPASP
jgi:hypothetical protein